MDRDLADCIGNHGMVSLGGDLLGYLLRMDRYRPHRYRHSELARGCGAALGCVCNPGNGSSHLVRSTGLHHRSGDHFTIRNACSDPSGGDRLSDT